MSETKLLPCPFCGKDPVFTADTDITDGFVHSYTIACHECGFHICDEYQDFRDAAVTWLAMAGCTIPQICAITGHSFKTANDILKHYLALNAELADSAIAKLIIWFDEKTEKTAHD